jgi:hypothetical protein
MDQVEAPADDFAALVQPREQHPLLRVPCSTQQNREMGVPATSHHRS